MSDSRSGQAGAGQYRLEVENFGPIEKASVALRPLTVFVGPSNTGKSYLAILIYALHRLFPGSDTLPYRAEWARFGPTKSWFSGHSEAIANRLEASARASLRDWIAKTPADPVPALPADVSAHVRAELEQAEAPTLVLQEEMRRCYGVEHLGDLVRRQSAGSSIGLIVPRDDGGGGRYHLTLDGWKRRGPGAGGLPVLR